MWSTAGLILSLSLATASWWRSHAAAGPFDGAVYGMTRRIHRSYAVAGIAFAATFAASLVWPAIPVIPLLATVIVVVIFYAASFLRGAESDE